MPFDGTQLSEGTQALIEGKRLIENGWCQGSYQLDDRVCMLGAIGGDKFNFQAAHYLAEAADTWSVAGWNDMPSRTKEQVLAAFDRAIELSMRS